MEMTVERQEMLIGDLESLRQQGVETAKFRNEIARFQGKIEGSVRVLHFFVSISALAAVALCGFMYNAFVTLSQLRDKMIDIKPIDIQLMQRDILEIKAKIIGLEDRSLKSNHAR